MVAIQTQDLTGAALDWAVADKQDEALKSLTPEQIKERLAALE